MGNRKKAEKRAADVPTWRTVHVPVERLVEPEGPNPNVMPPDEVAKLAQNMAVTGVVQPILVRVTTGPLPPVDGDASAWASSTAPLEVVDGSHRKEAALMAHIRTVPVTVIQVSDAQARALRVGMNRLRGDLDLAVVGRMLKDLADASAEASVAALAGYDPSEVNDLILAVTPTNAELDAMAALGGATPPPAESGSSEERRFLLEVAFLQKGDRDRVKKRLKELGDGDAAQGLFTLLAAAGDNE